LPDPSLTSDVPKVSICVPAYNRPEGLRAAVASVLDQTVTDLEVVVSDDSDQPQDLASVFGDARVCYHWNQERRGMAGNWQNAINLARGEFIGLLMDDDKLLPGFVERCLAVFSDEPSVGVVFSNHLISDGTRTWARPSLLVGGSYDDFLPQLLHHEPVCVSSTLMRRTVWEDVLPVPQIHTADIVLQVRAAQAGNVFHYIDEPLMTYGVGHPQLSGEPVFRDHIVELWRELEFQPGSWEERHRQRQLALSLLSVAAGQIQIGNFDRAAAAAAEVSALGVPTRELGRHARLIAMLTRSRLAMRAAALAFRTRERLRRWRADIRT
jgi:glycosyltransferase involved in cell wall biosynthesis